MELKNILEEKDKQIRFIANKYNETIIRYKKLEETLKTIQDELAKESQENQHE